MTAARGVAANDASGVHRPRAPRAEGKEHHEPGEHHHQARALRHRDGRPPSLAADVLRAEVRERLAEDTVARPPERGDVGDQRAGHGIAFSEWLAENRASLGRLYANVALVS
jgi:hypothetical protein